jgi:hypothetical protein
MESKYLEFLKIATLRRTDVYSVLAKASGMKLGEIKWFGRWRQYAFFPCGESVWNLHCLADIQRFLEEIK